MRVRIPPVLLAVAFILVLKILLDFLAVKSLPVFCVFLGAGAEVVAPTPPITRVAANISTFGASSGLTLIVIGVISATLTTPFLETDECHSAVFIRTNSK